MNALYWRDPLWALLGLLPVLGLAVSAWRARRLRFRYAEPALWPWALSEMRPRGSHWRRVALLLAWLLLDLAAAGPRLPAYVPPQPGQHGATVAIVLDLSRSMDAADVWPSRRRLALRALEGLLPRLAGSRVGLVVAAGHAHRLWPASADRTNLALLASQLHALQPPSQGSDLAAGVRLATADLTGAAGIPLLLVLSDGDLDGTGEQAFTAALREAAGQGIDVLIGGVGTPGGAALPDGEGGWLQQGGQPVLSRLADARLSALAHRLHGRYLTLPEQGPADALSTLLPAAATRLRLDTDAAVLWRELFPWLLVPAALLWLIASLPLHRRAAPAGIAATAVYLLGLATILPAQADTLAQAHRALAAGDLSRARSLYAELPGYAGRMGSGSACHRLGDWPCARQAFAQAVLDAPDDQTRARALYNLAHSVFQTGDFAGAAALFDDALRYRPDYPAARHNRDFAQELALEVARLAGGPQAERSGRGGAAGPAGESSITAGSRLQLQPREAAASTASDPEAETRPSLLERGLAFTRLAESRAADAAAPWGRSYSTRPAAGADIVLWQTLLERAEGLPATPAQPRILPGVRPW